MSASWRERIVLVRDSSYQRDDADSDEAIVVFVAPGDVDTTLRLVLV